MNIYNNYRTGRENIINQNNNDPEINFYYSGVYGYNDNKIRIMPGNIRHDFEPFCKFLKRSIESKENSVNTGAEFRIPDKEQNLILCDSVIKTKSESYNVFSVSSDELNLYELIFDPYLDNDFYKDNIKEISIGRINVIWSSKKDSIYSCAGSFYILTDKKNENNQKVNVWLNDGDDVKAVLQSPDYGFLLENNKIYVENCNIKRYEISKNSDSILFYYEGVTPDCISIFDKKITKITSENNCGLSDEKLSFIISGKTYDVEKIKCDSDNDEGINRSEYDFYLVRNVALSGNEKSVFNINGKSVKYIVCTNDEIYEMIDDEALHFSAGCFSCSADEVPDENIITFGQFHLKKGNSFGYNFKRRLKDKSGKTVGTIIELIEDDDFKNDIYSNLDIFFAESTRELSDNASPKEKNRRKFRIGWTSQNDSLMEIAEIKNNHIEKINFNSLKDKKLYAVADTSQLKKQLYSLNRLMYKPLPGHKPLLELTEKKSLAKWNDFAPAEIDKWYRLTNESYEGCDDQREFVKKALGTPDFAFLDGPPGSGKTTAILELIAQSVERGQKIMLAASTNAAVDNILERLDSLPEDVQNKILAVRLGNSDRISEKVNKYNINNMEDNDLRTEIIKRANLVCSTIFGILQHPEFNIYDRAQPAVPIYDYLIIDEASKTTFQDFIVPALYAKRWILSGDLRQLTPYTEQEDMEAALRENNIFDKNHQFIQSVLLLFNNDNNFREREIFKTVKLCIPVSSDCLEAAADLISEDTKINVSLIGKKLKNDCKYFVSFDDFYKGCVNSFIVFGSDIVFIEDTVYEKVQKLLPANYVPVLSDKNSYYLEALNNGNKKLKDISFEFNRDTITGLENFKNTIKNELNDKSWAKEIIWRLCRLQELFFTDDTSKCKRYESDIRKYVSKNYREEEVFNEINLIKSIALPSIMQLLRQGVSDSVVTNKKDTALNSGIPDYAFQQRYTILRYQHRMHPAISEFSRNHFYNNALLDPEDMEDKRSWNCPIWDSRSVWEDVHGSGSYGYRSKNQSEVNFIYDDVKRFMNWASKNPNPDESRPDEEKGIWSVAILTYYRGQEKLLKERFMKVFNSGKAKSYYKDDKKHIELKIFTVDKFQGQEADVVYISLVKSGKVGVGFMDSPNRLNVALTRARFQRIIVGDKNYFNRTRVQVLKDIASEK